VRFRVSLLALASFALVAPSADAFVRYDRSTLTVTPLGTVTLALEPAKAARCRLTGGGVRASARTAARSGLAFSWNVGAARGGRYRMRVRCGARVRRVAVRVLGPRLGRRSIAGGPVHVFRTKLRTPARWGGSGTRKSTAPVATVVVPSPPAPGTAPEQAIEQVYTAIKLDVLRVGEGDCIAYVVTEREEIFRALVMPGLRKWAQEGFDPSAIPELPGDGASWKRIARRTPGITVSDRPTPGAILALSAGEEVAMADGWKLIADPPDGHLALVDTVAPGGGFGWSDMNGGGGLGVVWTYTSPASAADGLAFINLA
jgi:hypothetical protein